MPCQNYSMKDDVIPLQSLPGNKFWIYHFIACPKHRLLGLDIVPIPEPPGIAVMWLPSELRTLYIRKRVNMHRRTGNGFGRCCRRGWILCRGISTTMRIHICHWPAYLVVWWLQGPGLGCRFKYRLWLLVRDFGHLWPKVFFITTSIRGATCTPRIWLIRFGMGPLWPHAPGLICYICK